MNTTTTTRTAFLAPALYTWHGINPTTGKVEITFKPGAADFLATFLGAKTLTLRPTAFGLRGDATF